MRITITSIVLAMLGTSSALGVTTTNVSYQNGVNGYTGTFDMRISMNGGADDGTLGSGVARYLIDGYQPDNPETTGNEFSPDSNGLLRFDDIIGSNPGQIPSGAVILDAQLQVTTGNGGSDDSGGPWGVAGLLQAFTSATRYTDFPGGGPVGFRGAWWEDGYATRPSGGVDRQVQDDVDSANVRSLVQRWADGEPNHGLVLQAGWPGQTNGWGFYTTGSGNAAFRPKLSVTYTTDPVAVNTFQRDLNGYTGDTMAWVRSGLIQTSSALHPDETVDDITYDGYTGTFTLSPTSTLPSEPVPPAPLTSFQEFLDGPAFGTDPGVLTSEDAFALLKFGSVFGAGAGQAPADKEVAKAWLVLTTGNESGNARSNGNWAAYEMARDWDTDDLYSDIGATPGLQPAEGDIVAGELSTAQGMVTGSEVWFDVTSYLEDVRNGATDYGLAITHFNTADGWEIHLNGSPSAELRPRLVVVSDLAAPVADADYNDDGKVDAADYVLWRKTGINGPQGYADWSEQFGSTPAGAGGGAVPEPATWLLGLVACAAIAAVRKR